MKKLMYISAAFFIMAAIAVESRAQSGKVKLQLNYNVGIPLGSFRSDLVNKPSYNGGSVDVSYWFNPKFALGGYAGYQDYFYKWDRQVYSLGKNGSISAVLSNSIQTVPILVKGTYSPLGASEGFIKPYVSAGAGVNLVQYRQYLGEFSSFSDASASFAAQGGAGVLIAFPKSRNGAGINLGATYNYVPYSKNGINNLSNLGLHAGVMFNLQ